MAKKRSVARSRPAAFKRSFVVTKRSSSSAPSPRALFPQSLVGFTVQEKAMISPVPTRFGVGSNEMVLWVVGNTSGSVATVTLQDFLRDSDPTDPVNPLIWLVSNSVQIADGEIGIIA